MSIFFSFNALGEHQMKLRDTQSSQCGIFTCKMETSYETIIVVKREERYSTYGMSFTTILMNILYPFVETKSKKAKRCALLMCKN